MMRVYSRKQKNLHQEYRRLSKRILPFTKNNLLEVILEKGFFQLPIASQYGGKGLSWQDCIAALNGLFSIYFDVKLFSYLISQISAIYLVSRYGSKKIKKEYLPLLASGEVAVFIFPEKNNFFLGDKDNYHMRNEIIIQVREVENSFNITIKRNNSHNDRSLIFYSEDYLALGRDGSLAFYDFINFKRILCGIVSSRFFKIKK